jgi:hypothetical protein
MFLSVVILGRFTTETHAMAPLHQARHAATTYTTPRDAPTLAAPPDNAVGLDVALPRDVPNSPSDIARSRRDTSAALFRSRHC